MKEDSWFSPGDKVMRVGNNTPGIPVIPYPHDRPKFGKVYCVSKCFKAHFGSHNQVTLVGFPPGYGNHGKEVGWPANAFRLVEEIRLCVSAVSSKHCEMPHDAIMFPVPGR